MMAGVVAQSTQYWTDQDLLAIAEYLKSLPPANGEGQGGADAARQASESSAAKSSAEA
jgi:hypothetical protein